MTELINHGLVKYGKICKVIRMAYASIRNFMIYQVATLKSAVLLV